MTMALVSVIERLFSVDYEPIVDTSSKRGTSLMLCASHVIVHIIETMYITLYIMIMTEAYFENRKKLQIIISQGISKEIKSIIHEWPLGYICLSCFQ